MTWWRRQRQGKGGRLDFGRRSPDLMGWRARCRRDLESSLAILRRQSPGFLEIRTGSRQRRGSTPYTQPTPTPTPTPTPMRIPPLSPLLRRSQSRRLGINRGGRGSCGRGEGRGGLLVVRWRRGQHAGVGHGRQRARVGQGRRCAGPETGITDGACLGVRGGGTSVLGIGGGGIGVLGVGSGGTGVLGGGAGAMGVERGLIVDNLDGRANGTGNGRQP